MGEEQRGRFLPELLNPRERKVGLTKGCKEIKPAAKELAGVERTGLETVVLLHRIFCIVTLPEHFTSVSFLPLYFKTRVTKRKAEREIEKP